MISLLAALVIARTPSWPRYEARFVDLSKYIFNSNIQVFDARPEGSIAGYSYMAMVDVAPAAPLGILRGVPCGMRSEAVADSDRVLWPYRVLSNDLMAAFLSSYPSFEDPRSGKYVVAKASGPKLIKTSGHAPPPSAPSGLKYKNQANHTTVPNWLLPEVKRNSSAGYEDRWDMVEIATPLPYRILDVTYYPVTPGYEVCMHDAEKHLTVIQVGGQYRPLRDCVAGGSSYDLRQIVWLSKDGWMVIDAYRDNRHGLVWLTPKK